MAESGEKGARGWRGTPVLPSGRPAFSSRAAVETPNTAGPVRAVACTDVGLVRQNNEDTFRSDESGLYVVCDGMGGMAAGEVASQIAADTFVQEFLRPGTEPGAAVQGKLDRAVAAANREVLSAAREPGRSGMGTTLVAAALDGERMVVVNVGDSRAYLLHEGICHQVTRDHSYANEVQRISGLEGALIRHSDLRRFASLITRAIGAATEVEPDFFSVPFCAGDVLLLASDGLTRYFDNAESLLPLLNPADLEGSCHALITAAKKAGGVDNITVLLLGRDAALPY